MEKKDDDSLPQKNVPYHDDRFIHRCQVRLCEDNQLYMLPTIYLINIRRFHIFFAHSLMLDSREKERERRMVLLRLGFNDEERKEKCLLYHPVEEMKKFNFMKTKSVWTFGLENIVASIESPFIRPSSTLRTKTTRRTI